MKSTTTRAALAATALTLAAVGTGVALTPSATAAAARASVPTSVKVSDPTGDVKVADAYAETISPEDYDLGDLKAATFSSKASAKTVTLNFSVGRIGNYDKTTEKYQTFDIAVTGANGKAFTRIVASPKDNFVYIASADGDKCFNGTASSNRSKNTFTVVFPAACFPGQSKVKFATTLKVTDLDADGNTVNVASDKAARSGYVAVPKA